LEEGSTDPNYVYEYQELILNAEYEVVHTYCGEGETWTLKKVRILDGNSSTEDELQDTF